MTTRTYRPATAVATVATTFAGVFRLSNGARCIGCVAAALLALLLIPGHAQAGDTVITFEDLGAGMVVSNQYASRGIELITSVAPTAATAQRPTVRNVAPGKAQSGTRIADAWACGHDFCKPTILGRFDLPRHVVRVHVGVPGESSDRNVVLVAYGGSGASLATQVKSVKPSTGYHTELSVSTVGQKIVFFQVYAARDGAVLGIDDLSFDATTKTSPDFGLFPATAYTGLNLHKGGSVSTVVNMNRFGGSEKAFIAR